MVTRTNPSGPQADVIMLSTHKRKSRHRDAPSKPPPPLLGGALGMAFASDDCPLSAVSLFELFSPNYRSEDSGAYASKRCAADLVGRQDIDTALAGELP